MKDVDVVFDTIGGETQERSFRVLKTGGFLVSVVNPPSRESAEKFGVKAEMIGVQPNQTELAEITELAMAGKLKTHIAKVLSFLEVKEAHELSQAGHTKGKIVLEL